MIPRLETSAMNESVPICARCGGPMPVGMEGSHCPACAFAGIDDLEGDKPEGDAGESTGFRVRQIGDYELLAVLGKGGMGVVYQARQLSLGRFVAVKLLRSGEFSDEEAKARFKREARLAAKLVHPHIVRIHDAGEHDGQLYFSMDYVPGRSLADLLKRDLRWVPRRAADCVRVAAEAVQAAHSAGVMHRDIKPGNFLIHSRDGQPYLTDFGLAKSRDTGEHLTLNGGVGTPSYVAPEQIDPGPNEPGAAADIYGLGAVLYHLLTGRPPHEGKTEMQILKHALEGEIRSPNVLQPDVPQALADICLRCLNRDPAKRYSSARDLSAALAEWIRSVDTPLSSPAPAPAVPAAAGRRKFTFRPYLAVVATVTLLGVLVVMVWRLGGLAIVAGGGTGGGSNALALVTRCLALPPSTNHLTALVALATELRRDERSPQLASRLVELIERTPFVRGADDGKVAAGPLAAAEFGPGGLHLATVTVDGRVQTWNLANRDVPAELEPVGRMGLRLVYSPAGDRLAVIGATNARVHWLGGTGAKPVSGFAHPVHIRQWQFLPGRDEVLTIGEDGRLRAWSLSLGTELRVVGDHPLRALAEAGADHFTEVECDATGRHWLLTTADQRAFLWDSVPGRLRALGEADTVVQLVRLDPAGGHVWLLDRSGRMSVWDIQTATRLGRQTEVPARVIDLAFAPDGDRAITWGDDGGLQRWTGRATTPAGAFGSDASKPIFVRYSPDGLQVLVGTGAGELHVFDARDGEPLVVPWRVDALLNAAFAGRAGRVVTVSALGSVRHWEIPVRANSTNPMPAVAGGPGVSRSLTSLAGRILDASGVRAPGEKGMAPKSSEEAPLVGISPPLARWLEWQRALPSGRSWGWQTDEPASRLTMRWVREGSLASLENAVRLTPENSGAWAALADAASRVPPVRRPYTARAIRFFAQRARQLAPGDAAVMRLVRDVDERLGGAM